MPLPTLCVLRSESNVSNKNVVRAFYNAAVNTTDATTVANYTVSSAGYVAGTGTGHAVDANTLALWKFDEVSGNAIDQTGTYTATANGAPGSVPSVIVGNGRSFNMTTQWFDRTHDVALETDLIGDVSLETWVLVNSGQTNSGALFCFSGGTGETAADNALWSVFISSTRAISVIWENGAGTDVAVNTATGIFQFGVWNHIAATRRNLGGGRGYEVIIYLNGFEVTRGQATLGPTGGTTSVLALGRQSGNATTLLNGSLDDMRLSKVCRTPDEIFNNFKAGSVGRVPQVISVAMVSETIKSNPGSVVDITLAFAPDPTVLHTLQVQNVRNVGNSYTILPADGLGNFRFGTVRLDLFASPVSFERIAGQRENILGAAATLSIVNENPPTSGSGFNSGFN